MFSECPVIRQEGVEKHFVFIIKYEFSQIIKSKCKILFKLNLLFKI